MTVCSRGIDGGGLSAVCGGFRLCKMEEGSRFYVPFGRKGSGLGLSIVYQIMELHRGKVSIWEENGKVYVEMLFPFLDYVSVV